MSLAKINVMKSAEVSDLSWPAAVLEFQIIYQATRAGWRLVVVARAYHCAVRASPGGSLHAQSLSC